MRTYEKNENENENENNINNKDRQTRGRKEQGAEEATGYLRRESQVELTFSPKQRAKPKSSARKEGSSTRKRVSKRYTEGKREAGGGGGINKLQTLTPCRRFDWCTAASPLCRPRKTFLAPVVATYNPPQWSRPKSERLTTAVTTFQSRAHIEYNAYTVPR
jgi:hypothetical protein